MYKEIRIRKGERKRERKKERTSHEAPHYDTFVQGEWDSTYNVRK